MRLRSCGWALLAVLTTATSSVAAVLCAPKSGVGAVTVRPACKPNQVQLDPISLGLQGPPGPKGDTGNPGPQGPAGPAGPTALVLVDSTGAKVGDVVGADTTMPNVTIATAIGNQTVLLTAARSGFGSNSPGDFFEPPASTYSTIYFSGLHCSGPAYIKPTMTAVLPWLRVVVREDRYAYIPASSTIEDIVYQSAWLESPSLSFCNDGPFAPPQTAHGVVATSVVDLFSLFTPPFDVRTP